LTIPKGLASTHVRVKPRIFPVLMHGQENICVGERERDLNPQDMDIFFEGKVDMDILIINFWMRIIEKMTVTRERGNEGERKQHVTCWSRHTQRIGGDNARE
jgi:hypothetical protein